jgi:Colicin V production protein
VNVLDLVILAVACAAGYFGYRIGFVARVASWIGLAIGVVLAIAFVDDIVDLLSSQPSQTRSRSSCSLPVSGRDWGLRPASLYVVVFPREPGCTAATGSEAR